MGNNSGLNYYEYKKNEISGAQLAYRLTGDAPPISTLHIYGAIIGSGAAHFGKI
jgi:hypothetical protein